MQQCGNASQRIGKWNSLDCDSSTSMHEICGCGLNIKNQRRHRSQFHSRFDTREGKSRGRKSSGEKMASYRGFLRASSSSYSACSLDRCRIYDHIVTWSSVVWYKNLILSYANLSMFFRVHRQSYIRALTRRKSSYVSRPGDGTTLTNSRFTGQKCHVVG